jgi:transcriptional regulator with XRE-family HTH domain
MKKPKNAVGPQLMRLRNRLGLSQAALAARFQLAGLDVSRDIIARIELQTRRVTDLELIELARVLRVSAEQLLGRPKKDR